MSQTIQRKGQAFGQLTVTGKGIVSGANIFWICSCSCGVIRVVEEKPLVSGDVTMCTGCSSSKRDVGKLILMAESSSASLSHS